MTRGYFGIGTEGISKSANMGALMRTAHAFGAAFCFSIGAGYDARAARQADTSDTPAHVPIYRYQNLAELQLPEKCQLVGIERLNDAVDLPSFRHPLSAAYILGPERSGLSPALLARCDHVIRIPTQFALNLSVAGALVLYDRLLQHGRFLPRPITPGGPPPEAALRKTSHGQPKFRKRFPEWHGKAPADES